MADLSPHPESFELSGSAWLAGSVLFYLPAAALACGWVLYTHGLAVLGDRIIGSHPLGSAMLGLLCGGVVVVASRGLDRLGWLTKQSEALREIFGPLSLSTIFALALLSGICEELVFRTALQPEIGLVAASLLFGAVHVPVRLALWPWPVFAAAMGFGFGGLYELTGGTVAAMACHFAINAGNLAWLTERPPARR